jgi:hypothetical protein
MRNNRWNLVWGVIGVCIIIISFVNNHSYEVVFGYELNIWVYRGIWAAISGASLFSYFKRRKAESN